MCSHKNQPLPAKQKTVRSSNLELYRVIAMMLIVIHHYVVNSGLTAANGPIFADPLSMRSVFLLLVGAWGKTCINCFMLITGYFMCKQQITFRKYAKLLLEFMFYRIVINGVFWATGYAQFSVKALVKTLLPVQKIASNFPSAFLVFYLFIPFLNRLIANITEKQHLYLLMLTGFVYVFLGTAPGFSVVMNYVSWFMVIYLIAAYIRLYPKALFQRHRLWGWMTLLLVVLSACSVVLCTRRGMIYGKNLSYDYVSDSNTFLAVSTALSSFLYVKNVRLPYSKWINTLGASTFGVLLIHANSDTMRQWLWKDIVDYVGNYTHPLLPIYCIGVCLLIFFICFALDWMRIRWIETPLFTLWGNYEAGLLEKFRKTEEKICLRLNISTHQKQQEDAQ